ncbi:ABC transporter permease [Microbulbifer agarilyticus]
MNSIDYPSLTKYLFWSELKSDLNKFMLGAVWWVLEPALYVAVFYFLFAELKGVGDFAISLICGIVTWQWINGVINSGASSVIRKKQIIQNFCVHPAIFPLVALLTATFRYVIVLMFAIALFSWKGALNLAAPIDLFLWFLVSVVAIFTYATFLGLVTPFLPDLQILISRASMMMMFLSGVIFPISKMPPEVQAILYWNPIVHLVEGARGGFLYGNAGDIKLFSIIIITHIPILIFSFVMLDRLRGEIPKRLV